MIANLYNKRVETANSPIMNQYAGIVFTCGWRRETNNLVCVALLVSRDKVRKASTKASETREQTWHRQEQNQTHDKHKILTSSLHRGFCTSVLFIFSSKYTASYKTLNGDGETKHHDKC